MRNFIGKLGFVILAIGASFADSESVLIPAVVAGVGMLMMLYSSKEEM